MKLKGIFQNKSIAMQFALFFAITFLSVVVFSIISYALLPFLFDVVFADLSFFLSDYNNPETVNALKFFQLFTSVGLFIVPPFLFVYFTSFQLQLKQKINRQSV